MYQPRCCQVVAAVSIAIVVTFAVPTRAEIALPAIIGDHMVLQQGVELPIWGWADPEASVVVTIGEQKHSTMADEDGRWMVRLDPLAAGGDPMTMTVAGEHTFH